MAEIVKKYNLIQSINTDTVESDIKLAEGESPHLVNTGIERDGGLTNLYKASESNSLYDEVFYCKSGGKVGLRYDSVNDFYRVYSNGKEVCQVPPWGVKTKAAVRAQAEDVVATTDGKLLTVRTANGKAVIEEYDPAVSWIPLRTKEITMDATILQTFFVRRIDQTFDTTDAVVGIYAFNAAENRFKLFDTSGLLYTGNVACQFNQIFAWWADYGYIIVSNQELTASTLKLLKSDGTSDASIAFRTNVTARVNRLTGAVVFYAFSIIGSLVPESSLLAQEYIPPAAPGGVWTRNDINITGTTKTNYESCIGGVICSNKDGIGQKIIDWYDGIAKKTWIVGHDTVPEFFGLVDGDSTDKIYIKQNTILYKGAYLSVSWDEFSIGKPITEIGEINPFYAPQIMKNADGDYVVVFKRSNETFGYTILSKDLDSRIQAISNSVVELNTIYAGNIIDTSIGAAAFGGNAFNGFVIPIGPTVGGGASSYLFAARHSNQYGNSVDTGEKTIVNTDALMLTNMSEILIENIMFDGIKDVIDVYLESEYIESIGQNNAAYIRPNLVDTLYVEDNRIPAPLGSEISALLFHMVDKIAVRERNYDGYQLANEITGTYEAFELYGSIYLFDGVDISQLSLSGGVVSSVDFVAEATGLRYLASAPTLAYFLSDFDNSLYSFDGGRAVQKIGRFNRKAAIAEAAYNVKENTLVLVTADSLIWIRDGIVTENDPPFVGDFTVFITENGTFFLQDGAVVQYLYEQIDVLDEIIDGGTFDSDVFTDTIDGGALSDTDFDEVIDGGTFDQEGAVCPFSWESAFIGQADNNLQVISRYAIRFFSPSGDEAEVTVTYTAFNQETRWTETKTFTIGDATNPWDDDGNAYISFRPTKGRALAQSIGVAFAEKLVLYEVYAYTQGVERAINKNQR